MTPERRDELRRADDAVKHARYTLDRKNYMATIAAQEGRIKALESLLAEAGSALIHANHLIESYSNDKSDVVEEILFRIDAILPATDKVV